MMSLSQTHQHVFQGGGQIIRDVEASYSGTNRSDLDETLAANGTREVYWAVDVSRVVALVITSNVDVVIKTNSSGSPNNTVNVGPNNPYVWGNDLDAALILTTDVVKIYVVIPDGDDCELQALCLMDATP